MSDVAERLLLRIKAATRIPVKRGQELRQCSCDTPQLGEAKDSRADESGVIRRRRRDCTRCGLRITTLEIPVAWLAVLAADSNDRPSDRTLALLELADAVARVIVCYKTNGELFPAERGRE